VDFAQVTVSADGSPTPAPTPPPTPSSTPSPTESLTPAPTLARTPQPTAESTAESNVVWVEKESGEQLGPDQDQDSLKVDLLLLFHHISSLLISSARDLTNAGATRGSEDHRKQEEGTYKLRRRHFVEPTCPCVPILNYAPRTMTARHATTNHGWGDSLDIVWNHTGTVGGA